MNNLIFVPELGLISGKSQNLKSRMWYPQPSVNKLRIKSTSKPKKVYKPSPFNKTQQLLTFRNRTQSPKKKELKLKSGLEISLQSRPAIPLSGQKKSQKNTAMQDEKYLASGLDLTLNQRPMTMANGRRKISTDFETEVYLNLPTLQQRPQRAKDI